MATELKKVYQPYEENKNSKPLLIVVQEESVNLKCDTLEFEREDEKTITTESELAKIKEVTFPQHLNFSVKVNLADSKKAFKNFIGGLDQNMTYSGLWDIYPHNPHTYPNPIGDVDMAPFKPTVKDMQ